MTHLICPPVRPAARHGVWRVFLTFGLFFSACGALFADGGSPMLNDVGNGALIWGTPSERTTWLQPYNSFMAPTIRQIPEESLSGGSNPDFSNKRDLWKTATEVGTVFGTDGKTYRYHYERGIEPRRVVERRIIDGNVQEISRVVWAPILIRVLEPIDKPAGDKSAANSASADGTPIAPCDPNTTVPPCDPATASSEAPNASPSANPNADPNRAPDLEAPNPDAVHDPTAPNANLQPGVDANGNPTTTATGVADANGVISVTVTTRDPSQRQSPRAIVAIPKPKQIPGAPQAQRAPQAPGTRQAPQTQRR